jgi:hypothetical protein
MKRQQINKLIIKMISDAIDKYPDLRFGQILTGMSVLKRAATGLVFDMFHEESDETLERIKKETRV